MVSGTLGQRIAAYRRRRGLSQAALAGLVGRSESWLSQVERGVRSVDRLSVLLDMARVLHVDVEALTGRPWALAPNGQTATEGLDELRRVFTRYDELLGVAATATLPPAQLRARVATGHQRYQAAEYGAVVRAPPALIVDAERARVEAVSTSVRREAVLTYVSAYVLAAKLVTKLGAGDLAILAADRAVHAAMDAESSTARGMSAYQVACALLASDQADAAERIAVGVAEQLEREAETDAPLPSSLAGALWLTGSVIAARKTDRGNAWERLDRAQHLAEVLGSDANHGWTAFGPTNVAIHRVSVAAELGDAGEALRVAADVEPDRLPEGLNGRRSQVHIDLAWAQAQRKRDAEATLHLLEAERVAPEAIRYNVIAREMVREMLARGTKSKTRALADLASRSGLLD